MSRFNVSVADSSIQRGRGGFVSKPYVSRFYVNRTWFGGHGPPSLKNVTRMDEVKIPDRFSKKGREIRGKQNVNEKGTRRGQGFQSKSERFVRLKVARKRIFQETNVSHMSVCLCVCVRARRLQYPGRAHASGSRDVCRSNRLYNEMSACSLLTENIERT